MSGQIVERVDNLFTIQNKEGLWLMTSLDSGTCEMRKIFTDTFYCCNEGVIKKHYDHITSHHMFPRSRVKDNPGIKYFILGKRNIKKIYDITHASLNILFSNMTPPEMVRKLLTDIELIYCMDLRGIVGTNGNGKTINRKLNDAYKLVFGDVTPKQAVVLVVEEWTPPKLRKKIFPMEIRRMVN